MGVLYLASSSSRTDLWFMLQSWVGWYCLVLADPRSHSLISPSSVRSKFSSLMSLRVVLVVSVSLLTPLPPSPYL